MSSSAARYFPGRFGSRAASPSGGIEDASASSTEAERAKAAARLDWTSDTTTATVDERRAPGGPSDEVLMDCITKGDKEALASLFRRYAQMVRGLALSILRDTSEADDLLQDIFLFIHRKCALFDASKGSARSWILRITYHRAIDQRRYLESRHFYKHVDVGGGMELPNPRSNAAENEEALAEVVGKPTIEMLLGTLTEDQRKTLTLHFFEGCAFEEIAGRLGQSVGNIRHHYYRGLDKLRKELFSRKLAGHQTCGKK
jgi:RNA polymerase sigma-70 factor (ECF subfamily)